MKLSRTLRRSWPVLAMDRGEDVDDEGEDVLAGDHRRVPGLAVAELGPGGTGQGSFQSIGGAPCCFSNRLARLNGRDPKNPRSAELGLGWADSISGIPSSSDARLRASRPHKIATSGACPVPS